MRPQREYSRVGDRAFEARASPRESHGAACCNRSSSVAKLTGRVGGECEGQSSTGIAVGHGPMMRMRQCRRPFDFNRNLGGACVREFSTSSLTQEAAASSLPPRRSCWTSLRELMDAREGTDPINRDNVQIVIAGETRKFPDRRCAGWRSARLKQKEAPHVHSGLSNTNESKD